LVSYALLTTLHPLLVNVNGNSDNFTSVSHSQT